MDKNLGGINPVTEAAMSKFSDCVRNFTGYNINAVLANKHIPFKNNATFDSEYDFLSVNEGFVECMLDFLRHAYDSCLSGRNITEFVTSYGAENHTLSHNMTHHLNTTNFDDRQGRRDDTDRRGVIIGLLFFGLALIGVASLASTAMRHFKNRTNRPAEDLTAILEDCTYEQLPSRDTSISHSRH